LIAWRGLYLCRIEGGAKALRRVPQRSHFLVLIGWNEAAENGFQTGDIILNVGGKAVANAGDVWSALMEANTNGKHSVLMQVKTADATRFVAMPLAKG